MNQRLIAGFLTSATTAVIFLMTGGEGSARSGAAGQAFAAGPGAQVSAAMRHDTSAPLRNVPFRPPGGAMNREVPIRVPPHLAERGEPAAAEDPDDERRSV